MSSLKNPAGHKQSSTESEPLSEKLAVSRTTPINLISLSHDSHTDALFKLYVPSAHNKHDSRPVPLAVEYVPAGQSAQFSLLYIYVPAAHNIQNDWPIDGWYLPLSHGKQLWRGPQSTRIRFSQLRFSQLQPTFSFVGADLRAREFGLVNCGLVNCSRRLVSLK